MIAKVLLEDLVSKFPGLYFQQIVRVTGLPIGTVDYNLWRLQRNGSLKSELILGKRRFFDNSFENPRLYGLLQEEIIRKIVLLLIEGKTQAKIAKSLSLSKSTISWYVKRLYSEGLLNYSGKYSIVNEELVRKIIRFNSNSERIVNNFISMWEK